MRGRGAEDVRSPAWRRRTLCGPGRVRMPGCLRAEPGGAMRASLLPGGAPRKDAHHRTMPMTIGTYAVEQPRFQKRQSQQGGSPLSSKAFSKYAAPRPPRLPPSVSLIARRTPLPPLPACSCTHGVKVEGTRPCENWVPPRILATPGSPLAREGGYTTFCLNARRDAL